MDVDSPLVPVQLSMKTTHPRAQAAGDPSGRADNQEAPRLPQPALLQLSGMAVVDQVAGLGPRGATMVHPDYEFTLSW